MLLSSVVKFITCTVLVFSFRECKTSINLTRISVLHDLLSKGFGKTLMKQNFTEMAVCLNTTKDGDVATLENISLKAVLGLLFSANLFSQHR